MNDKKQWKPGDRILIRATLNAPTNEREPSGLWWAQVDGEIHLIAVDEKNFRSEQS